MYLTDDGILIGLYGLISIFFLLFAAYAAREWRIERRKKRANAHLNHTKAQTWNSIRRKLIAPKNRRPERLSLAYPRHIHTLKTTECSPAATTCCARIHRGAGDSNEREFRRR